MDIKNFAQKILDFTIKRIAELSGISLITISILLFISLMSYSPEDPNFIFPENTKIKGAEPTVRRKYRDWTGKYHKNVIAPPESAYNRPLKRIVYDTWSDTRGIWLNR